MAFSHMVPWHEQTILVKQLYTCRQCNTAKEKYRAINNIPVYGHLCKLCWESDINKTQYIKVEIGWGAELI